jgi:hypothetical protein
MALLYFAIYTIIMTGVAYFSPQKTFLPNGNSGYFVGSVCAWIAILVGFINAYFGIYIPICLLFRIESELKEKAKRITENNENEQSVSPPVYSAQEQDMSTF